MESLLKLNSSDCFIDDNVPIYDLIIVDELESILKQFSSEETFKDRARSTYEFINEIIKSSISNNGKIIAMDGDLGCRSMRFFKEIWKNQKHH